MKLALLFLSLLFTASACGEEAVTPAPPPEEGFQLTNLDDTYASGTYRVAEAAIRFEVIVENGIEVVRISDLDRREIFRSEIQGDPKELAEKSPAADQWGMWHYGVRADMSTPMEGQPEVMQWIGSQEAQLVASMWRELVGNHNYESGPLNGLFRYGVHLDEALAFDAQGLEDRQEVDCSCYGACGPGCFSVGSNWYCNKHDCCCRTYGSWACYSWCFVYPKCPAAPCY